MWCIYTKEHYSVLKKEWNNAVGSDMDSPRDYCTKWSKSDKDKPMMSLTCGIYKNDTKQNRLTDIEDKLMVTKGERGGIN